MQEVTNIISGFYKFTLTLSRRLIKWDRKKAWQPRTCAARKACQGICSLKRNPNQRAPVLSVACHNLHSLLARLVMHLSGRIESATPVKYNFDLLDCRTTIDDFDLSICEWLRRVMSGRKAQIDPSEMGPRELATGRTPGKPKSFPTHF